jgi:hypothetical protein
MKMDALKEIAHESGIDLSVSLYPTVDSVPRIPPETQARESLEQDIVAPHRPDPLSEPIMADF